MRFFKRIYQNINVNELLNEVDANQDAWLVETSRQKAVKVQRKTESIVLRSATTRTDIYVDENQECLSTTLTSRFPRAMNFMNNFAAATQCSLSRAMIVRLQPQSFVYPHIDTGSYYLIRDRYHLVLKSTMGSILRSGNEQVKMREGELWWFNNKQFHSAFNESDDWRVHYIFDLLPRAYAHLALNPLPTRALHENTVPT